MIPGTLAWPDVVLALINAVQVVILAYLAENARRNNRH